MKSLPLPIRVAAGLAVTAVEQARTLPAKLAGLPVTVASQALQVSMRVQQQVTELAIRGDEVLASLRPVEETPEWATFDEDVEDDGFDSRPTPFESAFDRVEDEPLRRNGYPTDPTETFATPDPWAQEEQALAEETGFLDDSEQGDDTFEAGRAEGTPGDEQQPPEVTDLDRRPSELAGEVQPVSGAAGDELDVVAEAGGDRPLPEVTGYDELSLPQLRARLRRFSSDELSELLEYERAHGNRPSFVGMLTRRIAAVRDQR